MKKISRKQVYKYPRMLYNQLINNNKMNKMNKIDIKSLNRFAWMNDYSFDWNGYEISPVDGCYFNGYIIKAI